MKKYKTILIDPPWEQGFSGQYKKHKASKGLAYKTMTINELKELQIESLADIGCHLWLWTTNQFIEDGYKLMRHWGFKYLAPIHWKKPSGLGNYVVHLTQTILLGYYKKCVFEKERYFPNIFDWGMPSKHSKKPAGSYRLIENVSDEPRLELFARPHSPLFPKLPGWDVWGNEIQSEQESSAFKDLEGVCSNLKNLKIDI